MCRDSLLYVRLCKNDTILLTASVPCTFLELYLLTLASNLDFLLQTLWKIWGLFLPNCTLIQTDTTDNFIQTLFCSYCKLLMKKIRFRYHLVKIDQTCHQVASSCFSIEICICLKHMNSLIRRHIGWKGSVYFSVFC